ncbi:MAG: 4Fe-4S dicluster domain-containing protein [Calditrichaeota bacterium]|nr:4Fe-4S dicluster domain-containing protein [Calditrichota bacterium]
MATYFHAHQIESDRCTGHLKCMHSCPTQAIRIRDGKAQFSQELCVDCGTCLTVCPSNAIMSITDLLEEFDHFKYKVVVPTAVLYSQFDASIHPYIVHLALKQLGFDAVVDMNFSSSVMAYVLKQFLEQYDGPLPLISSHCPALIRLIQVKYPGLVKQILPLDVPREVTAREIRKTFPQKLRLKPSEIGIIYIAPCPAKVVSIKQPAEKSTSWFDGVVSIKDIYRLLYPHVIAIKEEFDAEKDVPENFSFHSGWAQLGSTIRAAKMDNWMAVSGLDHVMRVLDDIENSKLRNVDFLEAMTCMLGCIGGPLVVINPYVARANIIKQAERYEREVEFDKVKVEQKFEQNYYSLEHPILPRPTSFFDSDLVTSIKRIKERDRVYKKLPHIDCGCCGAPTCLAFAEDVVHGEADVTDCIYLTGKLDGSPILPRQQINPE